MHHRIGLVISEFPISDQVTLVETPNSLRNIWFFLSMSSSSISLPNTDCISIWLHGFLGFTSFMPSSTSFFTFAFLFLLWFQWYCHQTVTFLSTHYSRSFPRSSLRLLSILVEMHLWPMISACSLLLHLQIGLSNTNSMSPWAWYSFYAYFQIKFNGLFGYNVTTKLI